MAPGFSRTFVMMNMRRKEKTVKWCEFNGCLCQVNSDKEVVSGYPAVALVHERENRMPLTHIHIYSQLTVMHTHPPAPVNEFKMLLSAESWHMMWCCFLSLSRCSVFNKSSTAEGFSWESDRGLNPKIRSSLSWLLLIARSRTMRKNKSRRLLSCRNIVGTLNYIRIGLLLLISLQ